MLVTSGSYVEPLTPRSEYLWHKCATPGRINKSKSFHQVLSSLQVLVSRANHNGSSWSDQDPNRFTGSGFCWRSFSSSGSFSSTSKTRAWGPRLRDISAGIVFTKQGQYVKRQVKRQAKLHSDSSVDCSQTNGFRVVSFKNFLSLKDLM